MSPGVLARDAASERLANRASFLGALLCVAAGLALATGVPVIAAAILFSLGALCDLADGPIARAAAARAAPVIGKLVDSVADKVGEIGLWVGLLVLVREEPLAFALAVLAFAAGILTSFAKAFAEVAKLDLDWEEARLFGRAGRAVLLAGTLFGVALLPAHGEAAMTAGLAALSVFSCATLAWRSRQLVTAVGRFGQHPR